MGTAIWGLTILFYTKLLKSNTIISGFCRKMVTLIGLRAQAQKVRHFYKNLKVPVDKGFQKQQNICQTDLYNAASLINSKKHV